MFKKNHKKLAKLIQKPKAVHFIAIGLIFASLSVSISTGFVSNDANAEILSNDISNFVKTNTNGAEYLGVTVEKNIEGHIYSRDDNDAEFLRLYGVFSQKRVTFAAGFNLNKKNNISVGEFDHREGEDNYSMIYVGQTMCVEYEDVYKHDPYPLLFKFPLVRKEIKQRAYDLKFSISISESRAKELLIKKLPEKDPDDFTDDDYLKNIIGSSISVSVDGFEQTYLIQDIYLERDYYYDCLKEMVGDFLVLTDFNYPKSGVEKNLRQQRLYLFNEYPYQTEFFFDYLNSAYPDGDSIFSLVTYNFVDKDKDAGFILGFRNLLNQKSNVWGTIFIVFSILLAFLSLIYAILCEIYLNKTSLIICFITLFIPYAIFKLVFLITGNVKVFSGIGTKINGIILMVYAFALIALVVFRSSIRKRTSNNGSAEVDI